MNDIDTINDEKKIRLAELRHDLIKLETAYDYIKSVRFPTPAENRQYIQARDTIENEIMFYKKGFSE